MGETGSSLFNFEHKGVVRIPCSELQAAGIDPMDLAIEVGAEDVTADLKELEDVEETEAPATSEPELTGEEVTEDSCFQFSCNSANLKSVADAIKSQSFTVSSASFEYIPKTCIVLDRKKYKKAMRITGLLSEQDDVMEVYDNFVLKQEEDD